MAKKNPRLEEAAGAVPMSVPMSVPMYYADQPASLALSPNISRITFGIEAEGDYPQPVVTIALPTVSLLMLVKDLSKTFDSAEFKRDMAKGLEHAAKAFAAGTAAPSTGELVAASSRRKALALSRSR